MRRAYTAYKEIIYKIALQLMEFVIELFKAIVIDTILAIPGAAIKWFLLHGRRSYLSLLEDVEVNFLITLLIGFFICGIVTLCEQYI
jgi:hypothetical protein